MNAILKKVDGVFMAEVPAELIKRFGLSEGDAIEIRPSPTDDEEIMQRRSAKAVIERHGEALRMLADR